MKKKKCIVIFGEDERELASEEENAYQYDFFDEEQAMSFYRNHNKKGNRPIISYQKLDEDVWKVDYFANRILKLLDIHYIHLDVIKDDEEEFCCISEPDGDTIHKNYILAINDMTFSLINIYSIIREMRMIWNREIGLLKGYDIEEDEDNYGKFFIDCNAYASFVIEIIFGLKGIHKGICNENDSEEIDEYIDKCFNYWYVSYRYSILDMNSFNEFGFDVIKENIKKANDAGEAIDLDKIYY